VFPVAGPHNKKVQTEDPDRKNQSKEASSDQTRPEFHEAPADSRRIAAFF